LRLRWLLNALEEQTLAAERFEVIVVHDYAGADAQLLDDHPLSKADRLRTVAIEQGTGSPARQRNLGWREARAPLVAFVDDDCRPEPTWLEHLVAGAADHPGAIVQGSTHPDPYEIQVRASPHVRSLLVTPPYDYAPTCNIAYPRALLERVDGFDEAAFPAHSGGEDTDLAMRARATGAQLVAAPEARVYHSVEAYSLPAALKLNLKWRHLVFVFKRYPELRRVLTHRLFWRRTHRDVVLLALGLALASGRRPFALLAGPWVYRRLTRRGTHGRALLLGVVEMPGGLVVDLAEVATMCWGSAAYRTLVL
jgi:glycosyltransferase involved in cell wall biosynthesis